MKGVSPAAWNNINLHGKYEFNKNSSNISFSSLSKLIRDEILVDDILDYGGQTLMEEEEDWHRKLPNVPFSGDGQLTPSRRKRRSYISSILAKNEINRENIYNRKLFLRVQRGCYILNLDLQIKVAKQWINVYEILNLESVRNSCRQLQVIKTSLKQQIE